MWMTNGRRFSIKLSQIVEILGLSAHLAIPKKLHTKGDDSNVHFEQWLLCS
jgi:hypothetical protein